MWSATHDVVSREINIWKSFDLLLESNLWLLAPSAGCFTAKPPEVTNEFIILYTIIHGYTFDEQMLSAKVWFIFETYSKSVALSKC